MKGLGRLPRLFRPYLQEILHMINFYFLLVMNILSGILSFQSISPAIWTVSPVQEVVLSYTVGIKVHIRLFLTYLQH